MSHEAKQPLNELYAALAKAQGAIRNAVKDSENPHFKSSYADLASVWDACREPLSVNGLAILQCPEFDCETDCYVLVTTLAHASGQSISSRIPILAKDNSAQAFGSGLTYARRYSLMAIVGIAPEEDDDGDAATPRKHVEGPARAPAKAPFKAPAPALAPPPSKPANPALPVDPGAYVCREGSIKGKAIREVPTNVLLGAISFYEGRDQTLNSVDAKQFLLCAKTYLTRQKAAEHVGSSETPNKQTSPHEVGNSTTTTTDEPSVLDGIPF